MLLFSLIFCLSSSPSQIGDEPKLGRHHHLKGSPEGKWNQYLYTRGSKSGQVGIFYVSNNYFEIHRLFFVILFFNAKYAVDIKNL